MYLMLFAGYSVNNVPELFGGAKMEDVIFNGTDNAKPHGMAEVSITLADCASTLGVDYDEVCNIARRVFRSGESGYFLNRKACRLKDIQRLFMDTGVGTDSYSVLEQGKIDQILSARPEDRRAVFEEASGITKYKSDKKEALRKLEHTEANLLRLDDVIREVKDKLYLFNAKPVKPDAIRNCLLKCVHWISTLQINISLS